MFHSFIRGLLSTIFPKDTHMQHIESLSVEDFCAQVKESNLSHAYIHARFSYKDKMVQKTIHALKYRGNTLVASLLAHTLFELIIAELSEPIIGEVQKRPLIIPIPLSKKRFRMRGFNQAELLINQFKKYDTEHTFSYPTTILRKIKHTESQTKMRSRQERLKNNRGCFRVTRPDVVQGNIVLIIDDVTTTGATFTEAYRVVKEAGAENVLCFAVAH